MPAPASAKQMIELEKVQAHTSHTYFNAINTESVGKPETGHNAASCAASANALHTVDIVDAAVQARAAVWVRAAH
jgi:hypothetical protein